jgi:DNA-binding GntR family transcriptional regulator
LRAFLAALEARDEDAAWRACVTHIENAAKAALAVLSAQR